MRGFSIFGMCGTASDRVVLIVVHSDGRQNPLDILFVLRNCEDY